LLFIGSPARFIGSVAGLDKLDFLSLRLLGSLARFVGSDAGLDKLGCAGLLLLGSLARFVGSVAGLDKLDFELQILASLARVFRSVADAGRH